MCTDTTFTIEKAAKVYDREVCMILGGNDSGVECHSDPSVYIRHD